MKKLLHFISTILPGLFVALFGCAITYFVTTSKEKNAVQHRYLDKWVDVAYHQIKEKELLDHKIQLLFDGKPINGMSTIKTQLFNFTDKDYKRIPIFIEIIPQEGDSLRLVRFNITGLNGLPEAVKPFKDSITHTHNGTYTSCKRCFCLALSHAGFYSHPCQI